MNRRKKGRIKGKERYPSFVALEKIVASSAGEK